MNFATSILSISEVSIGFATCRSIPRSFDTEIRSEVNREDNSVSAIESWTLRPDLVFSIAAEGGASFDFDQMMGIWNSLNGAPSAGGKG